MTAHAQTRSKWQGLLCVLVLTLISYSIMSLPWMATTGISSLVVAIVLGIAFGNTFKYPASLIPGIQFSAKHLLRTAIILYGFRVSFQQIAAVGIQALIIDCLVVVLTLYLGFFIGKKIFKLDRDMSLLISVGSAICGAAAVLAVEDVLKSEPYKATIAIATVVLFGTASMFIYPLLQHAGLFGFTDSQFGLFAGASIHEVAQALVAGTNISYDTGKIAVIVKMMRVLLLVPVLFALSFSMNRSKKTASGKSSKLTIPWFALGFVAVIAFNSLHSLPETVIKYINEFDIILLTMAMGAIGIETKMSKMKQVGLKPFYFALGLFLWLLVSVSLMVKLT